MIDSAISLALGKDHELRIPAELVSACSIVLERLQRERQGLSSIGVTSALPGEGRSTVAAGLAIAQSMTKGVKTVLIDLDAGDDEVRFARAPSRSTIGHEINSDGSGTLEWISGDLAVVPHDRWNDDGRNPSRSALAGFIGRLDSLGLATVADLPHLPPGGTADRLAGAFDIIVQVVRAGSTSSDVAKTAASHLPQAPYVVLNETHTAMPRWLTIGGNP